MARPSSFAVAAVLVSWSCTRDLVDRVGRYRRQNQDRSIVLLDVAAKGEDVSPLLFRLHLLPSLLDNQLG